MFGRNGRKESFADAVGEVSGYGGDVLGDEKTRRRLATALNAGLAARERARRQTGMLGTVRRLAEDPVLRAQALTAFAALQDARHRVERRRSHKVRNVLLVVGGAGAATAMIAVPSVRQRVLRLVGGAKEKAGSTGPTTITEEIEVDAPLRVVYDQWTRFEEFPEFMEGVESVRQLDDTRLHWVAKVGGKRAEWDAKILHQEPDRRITWRSTDGKQTTGTVSFDSLGEERTRIRLAMTYTPEGALEQAGSAIGLDERRVRGDLKRFAELIERRGHESGGWRGEIKGGKKTAASERA